MVIRNDDSLRHDGISPHKPVFNKKLGHTILLLAISYLVVASFTTTTSAQTPSAASDGEQLTVLKGPVQSRDLLGKISFYLDPAHEISVSTMVSDNAPDFALLPKAVADFGYTKSAVWLRLKVLNETSDQTEWRLHFRENFKQIFDVFVVSENGEITNTLSQSLEKGFQTRSIQYPELVAPVHLEPGNSATVFVRYWSEGSSNLEFGFETADSFASVASTRTAKNFIYYGMMLILIIAALTALVVFRHMVFAAYAANAISILLYLMHADGVTFQYIWPNAPKFNSFASVLIGSSIVIFAANYARVFLNTKKHHPIMDKLFLGVCGFTVLMVLSTYVVDVQIIKKTLILMALITVFLCVLSGLIAARVRFKQVRFYIIAWAGFLGASGLMTSRHWLGLDFSQDLQHDIMRVVMVVDAALMGLAIADRHLQLRQSRQDALERSLGQANRNLKLNQRLTDLEKQYALAANLAESKDRQFANTIHDLRQPLHALRLNVRNLSTSKNAANSPDVEDTFSYLEKLVADHLDASASADIVDIAPAKLKDDENLGVPEILNSVHEMFSADAKEKGLDFKYIANGHDADLDPLVLMRIVTNLVSNAIKYTENGKVLLGSRKIGNLLRIEVHDTGSGLNSAEFEVAKQRMKRLEKEVEDPGGHGLGLQIVVDLAKRYGLGLRVDERRRGGTSLYLEVPLVKQLAEDLVAVL